MFRERGDGAAGRFPVPRRRDPVLFCGKDKAFFRKALAGAYRKYRKAGICLGTGVGWIRYGWKLPVFTETPEYGNFLEMEFAGKMTGGQTFGFFFRLPEERSAKRNPVSEEFEPLVGIRAECKDNGSDSWKICELVRDDTHAFLYSGIIKIRIPDEMGESGADRIRFVFSEGEYDVVPVLSEILLNPVELCQMEQIGGGFWGRGQDSQIRDSRWRAPGQFRPQWNWKQKLLSIREYLKPGDVSVIFPDQSRKDRHFVVDGESGDICFGDGIHGLPARKESSV